jgi:hypothetical protein
MKLETGFRQNLRYQISSKSVQREPSCSMRADGQTDMTKQAVAFRKFANAPKNVKMKQCMASALDAQTDSSLVKKTRSSSCDPKALLHAQYWQKNNT